MKSIHFTHNKTLRWMRGIFLSTALILLAGCNETEKSAEGEGELWKAEITAAFEQNKTIDNHRFQAEWMMSSLSSHPWLSLVSDGVKWEGVSYHDPIRFEADLELKQAEQSETVKLPMLIQDNKLYASIPMINKKDEYLLIDLADPKQAEAMPVSAILQTDSALYRLGAYLISEADPAWIELASEPREGEIKVYNIIVTEENAELLKEAVISGLSAWAQDLPEALNGREMASQAEKAETLQPGGSISVTIDPKGFISAQQIELSFPSSPETNTERPEKNQIQYAIQYSEINESPSMAKSVPPHVLPFDHLLAFLAAGKTKQN